VLIYLQGLGLIIEPAATDDPQGRS
jgi:hypothetical protein